jgi:hypothetical protein
MRIGIGLGLIRAGGGGGGESTGPTSVTEMFAFNAAQFPSAPITLDLDWGMFGSSNWAFDETTPSVQARLAGYLTNPQRGFATSGENSTEIKAAYDGAIAGANYAPGDHVIFSVTSNGVADITAVYPALYDDNFLPIIAAHPNALFTPSHNGQAHWTPGTLWGEINLASPAHLIDQRRVFALHCYDPASPSAPMRAGQMPPPGFPAPFNFVEEANASHLADDGQRIIAQDVLLRLQALSGGAPYLAGQEMLFPHDAASGDVLGTVHKLGTVTTWTITGGNDDGIIDIDASGVITRTAAAATGFNGIREVFIKAENASGAHAGRVSLMDGGGAALNTAPTARVNPFLFRHFAGAGNYHPNGTGSPQLTFAMRYRVPRANTNDIVIVSQRVNPLIGFPATSMIAVRNAAARGAVSVALRDVNNQLKLAWSGNIKDINNAGFNPADWLTVMFSVDNSVNGAVTYQQSYWQSNGTATPLQDLANGAQTTNQLTANFPATHSPFNVQGARDPDDYFDLDFVGIWSGYVPVGNASGRDLFFDTATGRLPAGFPVDGDLSADGLTPVMFFAGGCGGLVAGPNRAPVARKEILSQPIISPALSPAWRAP